MKKLFVLGCCAFLFGSSVIGCQNTAEGVSQDAAKNGAAVGNAADKAGDNMKNAADNTAVAAGNAAKGAGDAVKNAGEAMDMTPKVKLAIVGNATLNDTKNLINVDTKDHVVYLKGHVVSNDEKKLASQIAEKTIKEAGSSDKVMNQLTVAAH